MRQDHKSRCTVGLNPTAEGVVPTGQVPVNPVMAAVRHNKLISSESLCNPDTNWLLMSVPKT